MDDKTEKPDKTDQIIKLVDYFRQNGIALTELHYEDVKISMTDIKLMMDMDPTKHRDVIDKPKSFKEAFKKNVIKE